MSEHMTGLNCAGLLDKLQGNGLISDRDDVEKFIISRHGQKGLPLYIKILAGIGAFITAICIIGFLGAAKLIREEESLLIWGVIFCVASIFIERASSDDGTAGQCFIRQLSFAGILAGKIMFIFGLAEMFNVEWSVPFAFFIVTIATYFFYSVSLERFLSSLATLISLVMYIFVSGDVANIRFFLLNGFFLVNIIAAAYLLCTARVKRDFIPLSYAFAFSLCIAVLWVTVQNEFGRYIWRNRELFNPVYINIMFSIALVLLIGFAAGGMDKLKNEPLIVASVFAVSFGMISSAGVTLSIGLFVLGYSKHDRILSFLGAILLPVFLVIYYYSLEFTLYYKSGILIGSGLVLILGREYMKYKKWVVRGR